MALTTVSLIFAFSQEMLFTAQDVFSVSIKRFHDREPAVTLKTEALATIPNEFNPSLGKTLWTCRGKCSAQRKKCALFTSAIFLAWAKSGAMQN